MSLGRRDGQPKLLGGAGFVAPHITDGKGQQRKKIGGHRTSRRRLAAEIPSAGAKHSTLVISAAGRRRYGFRKNSPPGTNNSRGVARREFVRWDCRVFRLGRGEIEHGPGGNR
jgi:hypothetical protein